MKVILSLLKSKHFKIAAILSVLNILFCAVLQDPWIFVIRQSLLFTFLGLSYLLREELEQFSLEDEQIDILLKKKYPLLKIERPLFVGAIIATVFVANCSQYTQYIEFYFILFFSLLTIMCFIIFTFYKALCIVLTPEVRVIYKPNLSLSELAQRLKGGQLRQVTSAVFSKTGHVCKFCGKLLLGTGGAVWVGPKILSGDLTHRGEFMNDLAYPYNGYKVRSEIDATKFRYYVDRYPEEKDFLLDEKGYVKPLELDARIKEKNLLKIEHEHQLVNPLPKISFFSGFSKKD